MSSIRLMIRLKFCTLDTCRTTMKRVEGEAPQGRRMRGAPGGEERFTLPREATAQPPRAVRAVPPPEARVERAVLCTVWRAPKLVAFTRLVQEATTLLHRPAAHQPAARHRRHRRDCLAVGPALTAQAPAQATQQSRCTTEISPAPTRRRSACQCLRQQRVSNQAATTRAAQTQPGQQSKSRRTC